MQDLINREDVIAAKQLAEKLVKSFCPDDIFTFPGMILTREENEAICLLLKENDEDKK